MKTNFSLLFYMKKQKNYQAGAISPIYLRITIDGTRSEVTTGRSIDPLQWNPRLGRAKGYKESVKSFNFYLDDLQVKIHEAHSQLTKENQKITAQILRDRFLGKEKDRPTLLEVFKEHNRKMESLVGTEFSKGTMERYRTSLKYTVEFLNCFPALLLVVFPVTSLAFDASKCYSKNHNVGFSQSTLAKYAMKNV